MNGLERKRQNRRDNIRLTSIAARRVTAPIVASEIAVLELFRLWFAKAMACVFPLRVLRCSTLRLRRSRWTPAKAIEAWKSIGLFNVKGSQVVTSGDGCLEMLEDFMRSIYRTERMENLATLIFGEKPTMVKKSAGIWRFDRQYHERIRVAIPQHRFRANAGIDGGMIGRG